MQRHVPFEKGINFRDMGGYAAADGRVTKWKKLFRCGHMGLLTDADLEQLAALDTAVICDFRSSPEYERTPSRRSPEMKAQTHQLDVWPKVGNPFGDNINDLAAGKLSEATFFAMQKQTYRLFITEFTHAFARMFQLIDEAQGAPVVIHCTAGKDRTGLGASLILHALGVPEDTIHADYLLSNRCPYLLSFGRYVLGKGTPELAAAESEDARLEKLMVLLGANLDFLQVAYDTIREKSGSLENYLREDLGVTDAKRAKLREWFLES
jgi:protein-tyrosine phosphatase